MNLMTLAALCVMSASGGKGVPAGTDCTAVEHTYQIKLVAVAALVTGPAQRDAIARVTFAEAGNQGDTGLAGVVYTILNRLMAGTFGNDLTAVLDAPHQFEPVTKAGGWRRLPARSSVEQAHVDTILNLALDGRLPDPTNGARYFQNPAIVADRAQAGTVSSGLVNFGGQKPVAVIRDHAFYESGGANGASGSRHQTASLPTLFVPVQTASGTPSTVLANPPSSQPSSLFVPLSR
jgi:N-acetylmuramoyl-L-alanine amidase